MKLNFFFIYKYINIKVKTIAGYIQTPPINNENCLFNDYFIIYLFYYYLIILLFNFPYSGLTS